MQKIILITGSTDGIGKLAAIKLAGDGHAIYLHGRNRQKLDSTISEIKSITQNERISGFVSDLSDLDAVEKMVDQINNDLPKIDILINNAGIFKSSASHNQSGLDVRFAVNYLAPYLLTEKLIHLIKKGNDPRIINLSSAAQSAVSIDALCGSINLSEQEAYAQSKLALTMWSFHLAEILPDVAVIAVNPGSLLNTKMVAEAYGRSWSPADKGANILYDLAVSECYKGITGKYFDNDQGNFAQAHPDAYSEMKIAQLIQTTQNLI
ncbi:putative dehydrogenase/reductase family protein [Desulforapulum autotrophicum HRM2]|uniref:Dehydrogenase/reductase family protein n=1 Tax=Desulforapulum autotrophicum (strain ATCC 43914 / DSM 3382 / VKM B-1955 / HRM2) TaxID=177437 RepID=C0Q9P1_DESAH|nr:SDR family NAD(P)-dependent oxidoreductase [Desulforapulum autotrophicum]ACN14605.1 putative dehydrogenase/reductase family protein [Desulforapulum autotrophicum HRM2]